MQDKPFIIGIAGGTGSGKTTLAIELYKKYEGKSALVHLDDYFRKEAEIPKQSGFTNWEDPSALKFDELHRDLLILLEGKSFVTRTKSELFNPAYNHSNPVKIEHLVKPKPILIVEGFMLLYDESIRNLLDLKVFLDAPLREGAKRRSPTKDPVDQEYFDTVLEPMYTKIVAPTKEFADLVIDVSDKSPGQVLALVESKIPVI
jgi:uridine kinase